MLSDRIVCNLDTRSRTDFQLHSGGKSEHFWQAKKEEKEETCILSFPSLIAFQ